MKYRIKRARGKLAIRECKSTTMNGKRYEVGYNRVLFPRLTKRPASEFAVLYMYNK